MTDARDPTITSLNAILCSEALLHYSLMAATIPCLKPFVVAFNTGWGQGSHGKGSKYVHYSSGCSSNSKTPLSVPKPSKRISSGAPVFREDLPRHQIAEAIHDSEDATGDNTTASIISEEPQGMIIRQTRGWTVEHEGLDVEKSNGEK